MDTLRLGMNFFGGHDTSIFAIFEDDVYAISQERITRIKHDSIFPIDAINEMLRYKNINPLDIKELYVGVATKAFEKRVLNRFSYKMSTSLRRLIKADNDYLYIKEFIKEKERLLSGGKLNMFKTFLLNRDGREYLKLKFKKDKAPLDAIIQNHLQDIFKNAKLNIKFYEHHLCHAYSTYYSSNFDKSLVFTFDGEGDGSFSKLYLVENGEFKEIGSSKNIFVENLKKYEFADSGYASIGNIYSIFTHLLGYRPNSDEGKVEALAAFGDHDNQLYHSLCSAASVDKENLSIVLDRDRLNDIFDEANLKKLFNTLSKEDISAAVQKSTEKIALEYLSFAKSIYPIDRLCLSGGVTANVIMNMKIYEKLFDNLYIVPAMGDEGIAQGAAILTILENNKSDNRDIKFSSMPYFGSSYTKDDIKKALNDVKISFIDLGEEAYIEAAKLLVDGKIGAIFQGRSEFGPRALGNRSIIADVRDKDIQKIINKNIKNRPLFQPFCPSIIIDEKERLFEKAYNNKHMTIAFKLKDEFKDAIPGSVHVDLTARVQFVSPEDNPNYYKLIKKVKDLTGYGVIINTSFNKHGRTMVLTPKDAIVDFLDTNLDFMVLEGLLVQR